MRKRFKRRPIDYIQPGEQRGADWTKPTCVYVLTSADRVKIGIATDPSVRMGYLQLACPFKLELSAQFEFPTRRMARDVEKALHAQFEGGWLWGEWFVADATEVIAALRSHEPVTPAV